jgi:hypothetical protein
MCQVQPAEAERARFAAEVAARKAEAERARVAAKIAAAQAKLAKMVGILSNEYCEVDSFMVTQNVTK